MGSIDSHSENIDAGAPAQPGRRASVFALTAGAASLVLPRMALAQTPGRSYRIGWLSTASTRSETYAIAFTQRLAERGFAEGRNLEIVFRTAGGRAEDLPALAAAMLRLKCDLIFAPGNETVLRAATQAANEAASNIPIIVVSADYDPVASGHIAQLRRPGGRITGVSMLQSELPAKRIEVLTDLLPGLRRAAVLGDTGSSGQLAGARAAAARLGLTLVVHEFTVTPYNYAAAFAAFTHAKAEALLVQASAFFVPARQLILQLALQHRLPAVFNNSVWAGLGGLLSYGGDFSAAYRSAADLVVKVLNGANPGELPMEQSTIIEMVLNLKTARALNLKIPEAIRLRADRVIE